MLHQNHHFSFFVDQNENLQFKSREQGLLPYVVPRYANIDTKWDNDIYVLLTNNLTDHLTDWTLLQHNENL